jgi:hypothetical protein
MPRSYQIITVITTNPKPQLVLSGAERELTPITTKSKPRIARIFPTDAGKQTSGNNAGAFADFCSPRRTQRPLKKAMVNIEDPDPSGVNHHRPPNETSVLSRLEIRDW